MSTISCLLERFLAGDLKDSLGKADETHPAAEMESDEDNVLGLRYRGRSFNTTARLVFDKHGGAKVKIALEYRMTCLDGSLAEASTDYLNTCTSTMHVTYHRDIAAALPAVKDMVDCARSFAAWLDSEFTAVVAAVEKVLGEAVAKGSYLVVDDVKLEEKAMPVELRRSPSAGEVHGYVLVCPGGQGMRRTHSRIHLDVYRPATEEYRVDVDFMTIRSQTNSVVLDVYRRNLLAIGLEKL